MADVTTRQNRSKAMGIVGAAFGLGLVTGPALGGIAAALHLDFLTGHPGLARWGINPFSVPALLALAMCLLNQVWVYRRFKETLPPSARAAVKDERVRNPLRAILLLDNADARRANIVAFVYSVAFVAMETSLTFLATQRFSYGVTQNTELLVLLGFFSILTQGYLVRKLLKTMAEVKVLALGLVLLSAALLAVAVAGQPWLLYAGLAVTAVGSGLVNSSDHGPDLALCRSVRAGPRARGLPLPGFALPGDYPPPGRDRLLGFRRDAPVHRRGGDLGGLPGARAAAAPTGQVNG